MQFLPSHQVSPPHMGYCINVNTHQLWFFNFQNPASGFLSNMAPAGRSEGEK